MDIKVALILALLSVPAVAVEPTHRNVAYAETDGHRLLLDIYRPQNGQQTPVIVWVHGGAWRAGSKDKVPVTRLLQHGFSIASVNYRLSPVARFPAQIRDIKAAIRFLRAGYTQGVQIVDI